MASRKRSRSCDTACAAVGRDQQTVIRTAGVNVAWDGYTGSRPNPFRGTVEETVTFLRAFEGFGFRHICVGLDPCTPESVAPSRRWSKHSTATA